MQNPALTFRPDAGAIPDAPGCYQFRDKHGRVVYVGKAKSLRQRVGNYFQAWHNIAPRTQAMLESARSIDWIVVENEVEALHLEYTLIQRYRPRYNVKYRDDKSYPYLVVTTSEEVPRARVKRGKVDKGDRRFGPYAHAYAIRETLDLLLRVFPIRTCSQGVYDRAARTDRPCLLHHIDRCAAPCTGVVSLEEHRALVDRFAAFLDGETEPVLKELERQMAGAADEMNYEAAARLRDQLFAARKALEKQQMVAEKPEDFDAIAVYEDELEAAVQAFFVRRGRLVGRKGWTVDKVEPLTTAEMLTQFLIQLYEEREDDVPPQVLVPVEPDEADALSRLLADLRRESRAGERGRPIQQVRFHVPQRGDKLAFLQTVEENAREAFQRNRLKRASDFTSRTQALRELQEALDLEEAPLRIECYDISHLGGTEVVASMVVFEDGLPKKSDYRRFKLSQDRNDDFAAMREVMRRRFARYIEERAAPVQDEEGELRRFAYPPNLVIIDGGPGQLTAALEGVSQLRGDGDATGVVLGDIGFVSLAKRFEELWVPGRSRPVVLPRGSDALYLVQRLRDEAHRFAVTYQRTRRTKSVASSELDDIPMIGPARRKALLRRFGSVKALRTASIEDLMGVEGISRTIATTVYEHLHGDRDDTSVTQEASP
ncbi:MAG: excinuclease ABC subunit UvrC [Actinobacteria bacterium]|nr:excinuclease ABC subunit UvrC [Actinomycetota bacterium]